VDPYNPKVVRASMGAIFHVPIEVDVAAHTVAKRYQRLAGLDLQEQAGAVFEAEDQFAGLLGHGNGPRPGGIVRVFAQQPFQFVGEAIGIRIGGGTGVRPPHGAEVIGLPLGEANVVGQRPRDPTAEQFHGIGIHHGGAQRRHVVRGQVGHPLED
jgi:hypothetical protein